MKIIIFGSTGTIGKQLINQALEQNYTVSAFCRNINDLQNFNHQELHRIQGDVFNQRSVDDAVKGHDAVLIVLGAGRKGKVRAQGTMNIIMAMQRNKEKRLVCQATLGSSNENLNFFWKNIMFGWFLKPAFLDHELQEKHVKNSNLDWTIVRPAAFTNGGKTGNYKHGFDSKEKSISLKISRADVSCFLLKQIHTNRYLFKTPGLSY